MAITVPVQPVTVGPIVGHTTDTTVRLWGRGAPAPSGSGQWCYGVAQLLEAGSTTPGAGALLQAAAARMTTRAASDFAGLAPGKRVRVPDGLLLLGGGGPAAAAAPGAGAAGRQRGRLPDDARRRAARSSRSWWARAATRRRGSRSCSTSGVPDRGDRVYRSHPGAEWRAGSHGSGDDGGGSDLRGSGLEQPDVLAVLRQLPAHLHPAERAAADVARAHVHDAGRP